MLFQAVLKLPAGRVGSVGCGLPAGNRKCSGSCLAKLAGEPRGVRREQVEKIGVHGDLAPPAGRRLCAADREHAPFKIYRSQTRREISPLRIPVKSAMRITVAANCHRFFSPPSRAGVFPALETELDPHPCSLAVSSPSATAQTMAFRSRG